MSVSEGKVSAKSFMAVKKPIPVKVYDPMLTEVDDEGKALYARKSQEAYDEIIDKEGIMTRCSNWRYVLIKEMDLIIEYSNGDRRVIGKREFKKTYDVIRMSIRNNIIVGDIEIDYYANGDYARVKVGDLEAEYPESKKEKFLFDGHEIPTAKEGEETIKINEYLYTEEDIKGATGEIGLEGKIGPAEFQDSSADGFIRLNQTILYTKEGEPTSINWNEVHNIVKNKGLYRIECSIQNGAIKEVGINGIQLIELVKVILEQYKVWQEKCPCVQTDAIISSFETIIALDNSRAEERKATGIEGTSKNIAYSKCGDCGSVKVKSTHFSGGLTCPSCKNR